MVVEGGELMAGNWVKDVWEGGNIDTRAAAKKAEWHSEPTPLTEFRSHVAGLMNTALTPAEAQSNWALGLAGETGEVIELIKKAVFHGKEFPMERLVEELGGVLWYVQAVCIQNDITIEQCFEYNIEQLRARHGGTTFSIERTEHGKESK